MMWSLLLTMVLAQETPPIVGGTTTTSYKSVGQIMAWNQNTGYWATFCSGTLIHPQWVLTAAHCVEGSDAAEGLVNQGYDIYFLSATNVEQEFYNETYSAFVKVSSMNAHSGYASSTTSIVNDIALLKLSTPIYHLDPVPLNRQTPSTGWNDIRYVGFGITDVGNGDGGIRRTVTVPLNNSSNQYWPDTSDSMFMYTWDPTGQTNICSGDSGGAALRELSDGSYTLAGVNSFGMNVINPGTNSCYGVGTVAGSTRVDAYYDWIAARVDLSVVDPGGVEPSSEPATEPSVEPAAEPGSETAVDTGNWVEPFPDKDYEDDDFSTHVFGCSSTAATNSLWLLSIISFMVLNRRKEV